MDLLEKIANNIGVEKVMLSCFTANKHAMNFYERRGYRTDAYSPAPRKLRGKVIEPDYIILSRPCNRREAARAEGGNI